MRIETKYSLGDRIWVIYSDTNREVRLYEDIIKEIVINNEKILYYGDVCGEEIEEKDIILYTDMDKLIDTIKNISNKLLEATE